MIKKEVLFKIKNQEINNHLKLIIIKMHLKDKEVECVNG